MVTKLKIAELIKALFQLQKEGFTYVNTEEKTNNTLKISPIKMETHKIEAA